MSEIYFFDTYAIIEILKGSKNYDRFLNAKFVITVFNLVELHYKLLRDFDEKIANSIMQKYSSYVVPISLDIIREANKFKLENKSKNISVPDAMGYVTALKNNIKFVTGDEQFGKFKNVEFVK